MQKDLVVKALFFAKDEYDILIKAIDFYNLASATIDYGENIEVCQTIRNKIIRNTHSI